MSDAKRLAELQVQRASLDRAIAALELLCDSLAEMTPQARSGRAKAPAASNRPAKIIPFVSRPLRATQGSRAATSR